jgi:hypothetical protein
MHFSKTIVRTITVHGKKGLNADVIDIRADVMCFICK